MEFPPLKRLLIPLALQCALALLAPAETKEDQGAGRETKTPESAVPLSAKPLSELLREIAESPQLAEAREKFLAQARETLAKPLLVRPQNLEELKKSRIDWDKRYATADPSIREGFALARADSSVSKTLEKELPELASAYILTGDSAFLKRTLDQLDELTKWVPFQRPGWSAFSTQRLPGPEGDGVWLATGRIIQAIVETFEILPPKAVPAELEAKIRLRLEAEAQQVMKDWKSQLPWYVKSAEVRSNQWAIPLTGLVNASIYLGKEQHLEEYEFGIKNLLRTLDAQGKKGEFNEGLVYATATAQVLMSVARRSALTGDRRLIDHPFLRHFPTWHAQHLQPGEYVINSFDCGFGARGGLRHFFSIYSDMAVFLGSPQALWVVKQHPDQEDISVNGIMARALPDALQAAPPLFDHYTVAPRVNWRNSWKENASGFWIRGGDKSDFHDHMDRGHVNFVANGRAILIEAGTPGYGAVNFFKHYRSIAGHNVLQVGDFDLAQATDEQLTAAGQPLEEEHRSAPLHVERLDESGGSVTVDLSHVYPAVEKWVRHATWTADSLDVRDEVVLKQPDIVLFRWHLGSPAKDGKWFRGQMPKETVELKPGLLQADGYRLEFEGDQPLNSRLETAPDNTLGNQSEHHCLVVRSAEPVKQLVLQTRVRVGR